MTTPNTPNESPKPARLDRTRQQLQELDDLLQHMLALPITGEPEAPVQQTPQQRGGEQNATKRLLSVDVPRSGTEPAKPSLAKAPLPLQSAPRSPAVDLAPTGGEPMPQPALAENAPAAGAPASEQTKPANDAPGSYPSLITATDDLSAGELDVSGPGSMDLSGPVDLMAPDFRELEALESRLSVQADAKNSGGYGMLLNINRAYDHAVDSLGPLGRPLAGPTARTSLGWIGILCLLGAAALGLGMWLGWLWM